MKRRLFCGSILAYFPDSGTFAVGPVTDREEFSARYTVSPSETGETLLIEKARNQEAENKFCKVVENADIMRLQLFFEDKPEDKVRDILKGNGFKWSPKNGCWQRQLTANAKYALSRVIKELEKLEETA